MKNWVNTFIKKPAVKDRNKKRVSFRYHLSILETEGNHELMVGALRKNEGILCVRGG